MEKLHEVNTILQETAMQQQLKCKWRHLPVGKYPQKVGHYFSNSMYPLRIVSRTCTVCIVKSNVKQEAAFGQPNAAELFVNDSALLHSLCNFCLFGAYL